MNIVLKRDNDKFDEQVQSEDAGVVGWFPPSMDWNPWVNQPTVIEGAEEYQVRMKKWGGGGGWVGGEDRAAAYS